jgi:hypothetical protein
MKGSTACAGSFGLPSPRRGDDQHRSDGLPSRRHRLKNAAENLAATGGWIKLWLFDVVGIVLCLDQRQRNVRLEIEDVVGAFCLAAPDHLAAHDDSPLGEAHSLADLRHLIPPRLPQGGRDELCANVAFAARRCRRRAGRTFAPCPSVFALSPIHWDSLPAMPRASAYALACRTERWHAFRTFFVISRMCWSVAAANSAQLAKHIETTVGSAPASRPHLLVRR